jgi:hypothetical protein
VLNATAGSRTYRCQAKLQEAVIDEERPQALIGILAGENRGKRMVRLVFAPTAFTLTPRPPT